MNIVERLYQRIETYHDTIIEWQKNLVAIKALAPESGGDGELEKANYVRQILQDIGFDEVQEINAPDERVSAKIRPNILAKIYGEQRHRTVWVLSHLDVVPEGDLKDWHSDPFKLVVNGDKLIGRGVEDNHQGLVCGLLAAKALREEGVTPVTNIGLAIVADEENGSTYGLEYVLKHHREQFKENDLIIVPDAGDPEGRTIEVSEKSILWIKFVIKGKQCHASTPQFGVNAHRAAAHLVVELDKLYNFYPLRDETYDTPWSTFEPTKKQTNVPNINTIPAQDVFYYDCRVLPNYDLADVEKAVLDIVGSIREKYGVGIEVSYPQRVQAAPPTASDAPVVQALAAAIRAVKKVDPKIIGIGGGTVAALFRHQNLPAIVWGTIADTCHQPDEYALLSNIIVDAKILAFVFSKT
ncbi:M20 family metallo-hydrolase [candidate division KSB1 bacterium]|nr:M20 family metallo-hydrolase [candidate division KSB1 bacterium]RQW00228.1 MAG: M20 family metallo-hydrolase [candidate division KSB1 bacterium]